MVTYGTTSIPSDTFTTQVAQTTAIALAFDNVVGLVGGMDTANGSATAGEVVEVANATDAAQKFGDASELYEQTRLAYANNASTVYALPVAESTSTSEQHSTQSGTLDNAPLFDPNVNDEHSISVVDTGGTDPDTEIAYGTLSAPSTAETVRINPVTGDYYADAAPTGANYEFTYDHGDYSQSELQKLVSEDPRKVGICTENETVLSDAATVYGNAATDFTFIGAVGGVEPWADTKAPATAGYSTSVSDRRVSMAGAPRGYTDSAQTNQVRTVGAIAAEIASLPLGESATNNELQGLDSLRTEFDTAEAGELIDVGILPLIDYPPITIVKDMTTSSQAKFDRVYNVEIVDEIAEGSHLINRDFIGSNFSDATLNQLHRAHRDFLLSLQNAAPPLLDDFGLSTSVDNTDESQANVDIGVDLVDVMDTVAVTASLGDIVRVQTE